MQIGAHLYLKYTDHMQFYDIFDESTNQKYLVSLSPVSIPSAKDPMCNMMISQDIRDIGNGNETKDAMV